MKNVTFCCFSVLSKLERLFRFVVGNVRRVSVVSVSVVFDKKVYCAGTIKVKLVETNISKKNGNG